MILPVNQVMSEVDLNNIPKPTFNTLPTVKIKNTIALDFKDIYIDNLSLEESEYDLIQHEALSYQSKINQYGIEISKLTLEFMNIDVPHIEVFSNKLIDNPLSFMRTS